MKEERYIRVRNTFLARVVPILILFTVFTLMFGVTVFSQGTGTKTITYGGDEWNLSQDFGNRNWTTKSSTVTFKVNLSEDYQKAENPSGRPFEITASNGANIPTPEHNGNGVYTVTAHLPNDGKTEFTITVYANSWANSSDKPIVRSFTITKIAGPKISISGASHNGIYTDPRTITITVNDDSGFTIDKFIAERTDLNGGKHSLGTMDGGTFKQTFDKEGRYYFQVVAKNSHGVTGTKELSFIIDRSGPDLSAMRVGDKLIITLKDYTLNLEKTSATVSHNGSVLNVSFSRIDPFTAQAVVDLPKDENGNVLSGNYRVEWQSKDNAGYSREGTYTYTVGAAKPEITISGVTNGAVYNSNREVLISVSNASKNSVSVKVTRNNKSYDAGSLSFMGSMAALRHTFTKEGKYEIEVKAGNVTREISFTIDKTKPVITPYISGEYRIITDGGYYNKKFTPIFVLSNHDDRIVSITMNGRDVTGNVPRLTSEGRYNFVVVARDKAGNENVLNLTFTIDVTPPTLDISGVMEGYLNEDVTPVIRYYDENLDEERTRVTLNGKPYVSGTKLELEQDYVLEAYIVDKAGNVTEASLSFTIDKTAPVIKFMEPISAQFFKDGIVPELLIEDLSEYEILSMTLNGEPYELGQEIKEEGKHLLEIVVKDKAGNVQTIAVEFTIDMTPPKLILEGIEKNGVYYNPVFAKIKLENPEDRFLKVMLNGKIYRTDVITKGGEKYVKMTVTQIGDHEIKVIAADEAGNQTEEVIPFSIVEKGPLRKFYDNKPLFAGTIAGIAIVLGAAGTFAYRYIKRRRESKEIEEEYFN